MPLRPRWWKPELAGHHLRGRLDEGELQVVREGLGQGRAVVALQGGFRIEQLVLARAPFHEHEDDLLRLRLEMRLPGGERVDLRQVGGRQPVAGEQVSEGDDSDSRGDILEEVSPAEEGVELVRRHLVTPA